MTAPEVTPVAPACGADVRGIDLRNADHRALDVLRGALAEHSVVFVRDQQLSPDEQVALTARLGDVLRVPFVRRFPRPWSCISSAASTRSTSRMCC